jgi:hypothetical protein
MSAVDQAPPGVMPRTELDDEAANFRGGVGA